MIPLRVAFLLLFVVAVLALPLPMFGLEGSVIPAARFWQLGFVCLGVIAQEGSAGMIGLFAGLLLGHALFFTTLLALGAWLVTRFALRPLPPRVRDHVMVIALTLILAIAIYGSLYDTQFHHSSAHASLWELYF